MSVRRFPEPETMRRGIVGVCKWGCGKPVAKPALYWHQACFEEYALHTRLDHQKEFLIKRDGRRCAMKGCGCVPLKWQAGHVMAVTVECIHFRATEPDMVEWAAQLWSRPLGRWMDLTPEERATGERQSIERVCALEVDHRTPLWEVAHLPPDERRPYFGPENLWLLCPACHKAKTKREAAERAAQRRFAKAQLPLL
jgi:hypothetical protein